MTEEPPRDSDKRAIATWVLLVSVVVTFAAVLGAMILPEPQCWVYEAAMFDAFEKAQPYALGLFAFVTSTVSKDLGRMFSWRVLVIVSILGFGASYLLATSLTGDKQINLMTFACVDPTEAQRFGDQMGVHLEGRVETLCGNLAVWFGAVFASQLGIKIPAIAELREKFMGADA
jgi:hypothetical protein